MFDYLKELEVDKDKTVDYVVEDLNNEPTLFIVPATEANKGYFNALLKKTKIKNVGKKINTDVLARNRDEDRELYPKYVIKGWSGMVDDNNKEVKFDQKICTKFLEMLPDWIFNKLRNFAATSENFTKVIDIEGKAKN